MRKDKRVCAVKAAKQFSELCTRPLRSGLLCALLATGVFVLTAPAARRAQAEPGGSYKVYEAGDSIHLSELTTKLNDLQATMQITKCDGKELEKIGADFQRTYQFQDMLRDITLEYKQPDKMRISGKNAILGKAAIVMNGPLRRFDVPRQFRVGSKNGPKVEDLKDAPGKRQSLLEYSGLLAPSTLDYMQGKFVRQEQLDGQTTDVFDLTYKGVTGGSHYRAWFDPKTRLTLKREWYSMDGKLKATFYYLEPHEVAEGVWLPARVEVKNAYGVSAAITTLDNVKINQGLADDLFTIGR